MSVQIWPASVSVIQLLILAIGMGLWLWVWNLLYKNGVGTYIALFVAAPIIILFIIIAFFKFSELTLLPFIAKMIRTYFLDVTKKFQINWAKPDPKALALAQFRQTDHAAVIEAKEFSLDESKVERFNNIMKTEPVEK